MNSDIDSLELMLRLSEFGNLISEALKRTAGGARVTDNVSLTVLCHLELGGPMRPSDIVERTRLTSGGVTKVLTRIEDAGLVHREKQALDSDKRAVLVSLTGRGHELIGAFAHELNLCIAESELLIKEMSQFLR